MNGPQHYAEAERLLEFADGDSVRCTAEGNHALEAAKVHAALAAAAASLTPVSVQHSQQNGGAWGEALS